MKFAAFLFVFASLLLVPAASAQQAPPPGESLEPQAPSRLAPGQHEIPGPPTTYMAPAPDTRPYPRRIDLNGGGYVIVNGPDSPVQQARVVTPPTKAQIEQARQKGSLSTPPK